MIYASRRLYVVSQPDLHQCRTPVRLTTQCSTRVSMTCKISPRPIYVAQNTDRTQRLVDDATADYSAATEIYFTVWSDSLYATQTFQKTLTGGDISLPSDYEMLVVMDNTDLAIAKGRYYYEVAIETSGGNQYVIGQGPFIVQDTGTWDA